MEPLELVVLLSSPKPSTISAPFRGADNGILGNGIRNGILGIVNNNAGATITGSGPSGNGIFIDGQAVVIYSGGISGSGGSSEASVLAFKTAP